MKSANNNSGSNRNPVATSDVAAVHGECFAFKSELPEGAKRKMVDGPHLIIANSETTGNHHIVECQDGIEFYESNNGTIFMENSVPAKMKCVLENRHGTIEMEPGVWEFGIQKEYDYFTESLRNVRD